MAQEFDRWEFIEKWLPDYSQNDDVAYSNDLDCYIHGQTENSQYYCLKERFPDINDAIVEMEAVDSALFSQAYENYQIQQEKVLKRKREELNDARRSYEANVILTYEISEHLKIKADNRKEAHEIARRKIENGCGFAIDGFELDKIDIEIITE